MPGIYIMKGSIQHYAWGGKNSIANLLQTQNPENIPFAELWLGAHPKSSSIINEPPFSLYEHIIQSPIHFLGEQVAEKFSGQAPYLLKILDVYQMLSIQVHPTKKAAEKGFLRENKKQISLKSPNRNYKDKNDKPELMVALSDFWLIHGFKSIKEAIETCQERIELRFIAKDIKDHRSYNFIYQKIMNLPQVEIDKILDSLVSRLLRSYKKGHIPKSNPDFWAVKAAFTLPPSLGKYDRGIFSIYLFNLINLKKYEGIFQDSNIPHAYLEGTNIELMANSDNVLRGGLTRKHIDTEEFLKNIQFKPVIPKILRGKYLSSMEKIYSTPHFDFTLSLVFIDQKKNYLVNEKHSLDILFVLEGENAKVKAHEESILVSKGHAFLVTAKTPYSISSKEYSVLFKASVLKYK